MYTASWDQLVDVGRVTSNRRGDLKTSSSISLKKGGTTDMEHQEDTPHRSLIRNVVGYTVCLHAFHVICEPPSAVSFLKPIPLHLVALIKSICACIEPNSNASTTNKGDWFKWTVMLSQPYPLFRIIRNTHNYTGGFPSKWNQPVMSAIRTSAQFRKLYYLIKFKEADHHTWLSPWFRDNKNKSTCKT